MASHHDHNQNETRRETVLVLEAIERLSQKLETKMSQITDFAAQQQVDLTSIATTLNNIVTGIAALDVLISNFQNSPGTLSTADQAALDGVQASVKGLVTQAAAISVTPPQVAASAAAAKA